MSKVNMNIDFGTYKVRDLFDLAEVDFSKAEGDHRRFKVGGLSFDSLDDEVHVPETAEELEVLFDSNANGKWERAALLNVSQPEVVKGHEPFNAGKPSTKKEDMSEALANTGDSSERLDK